MSNEYDVERGTADVEMCFFNVWAGSSAHVEAQRGQDGHVKRFVAGVDSNDAGHSSVPDRVGVNVEGVRSDTVRLTLADRLAGTAELYARLASAVRGWSPWNDDSGEELKRREREARKAAAPKLPTTPGSVISVKGYEYVLIVTGDWVQVSDGMVFSPAQMQAAIVAYGFTLMETGKSFA